MKTTRRTGFVSGLALAAVSGMLACSKPEAPSNDLTRDLDAASSAPALTLAPTSGRRDVVSAVEQSPVAHRAPAPARKQSVARRSPVTPPPAQIATQASAPTATTTVATVPAPVTTPSVEQPATSRRPTPVQQAHQGRYKTEAEVFRDAPFPITP